MRSVKGASGYFELERGYFFVDRRYICQLSRVHLGRRAGIMELTSKGI